MLRLFNLLMAKKTLTVSLHKSGVTVLRASEIIVPVGTKFTVTVEGTKKAVDWTTDHDSILNLKEGKTSAEVVAKEEGYSDIYIDNIRSTKLFVKVVGVAMGQKVSFDSPSAV